MDPVEVNHCRSNRTTLLIQRCNVFEARLNGHPALTRESSEPVLPCVVGSLHRSADVHWGVASYASGHEIDYYACPLSNTREALTEGHA